MPRFFFDGFCEDHVCIEGEDAQHISLSLRMRPGEMLVLCDGAGMDFHCKIVRVMRERIELNVVKQIPSPGETSIRITLFQAFCKGDKMEQIVQKSVELGIFEIVPFLSVNCVARPDDISFSKKLERYNRIAAEAAKQCGRGILPLVRPMRQLSDLPALFEGFDMVLFFYEHAVCKLSAIPLTGKRKLALVVGAEGGFTPEEAALLADSGAHTVSLGNRILRCETAPTAALAALLYAFGEM